LAVVSQEEPSITYMVADEYFADTVILHQGELVDGKVNSAVRVDRDRPSQSFEFWEDGTKT